MRVLGVLGGAGMIEISAKLYFHRIQSQTHIFAKFHFSIIFGENKQDLGSINK